MPTLDWLGRQDAFTAAARVPYRLLEAVSQHGDAQAAAHNLLIQGDNLQALKSLLPMPPVFAHCSQHLSAANEAAATSLYWSVIQQDQPLVDLDVATGVLESAVRHNPWVGEPQMVLAQLYLSAGRRHEAAAAALADAIQQMCERIPMAIG